MAQEGLIIERILLEVEESARKGVEPVTTSAVTENETVVANLRDNQKLMALFGLLDMSVRAVHAARAVVESKKASNPWASNDWEGARDDFLLVKQLEEKRDLINALFFYELKSWLDLWNAEGIGIREGLQIVTFPTTRKTSEVLRELLNKGMLDDSD
jgi:hypothetical protein